MVVVATALAACRGPTDRDGDGFTVEGGDCDDADPRRHPDAVEVCDDGVDQDCVAGSCLFQTDGALGWDPHDLGAGNKNTHAQFRPEADEIILNDSDEPPLAVSIFTGAQRSLAGISKDEIGELPFVFGSTGLMYLGSDVVSLDRPWWRTSRVSA